MGEASGSLVLGGYRLGTTLGRPLAMPWLAWRTRQGKEDPARRGERLGEAGRARPEGPLVWVHAASVGETVSVLPLIDRLCNETGRAVLLTTGTVTSTRIADARLHAKAIHQYVPLDVPAFIRRFLHHWQPDLAVFAESELWPNMIVETSARGIPLALVNARMSERSFRRWAGARSMIGSLLSRLDLCLAQSEGDAQRLTELGARRVTTTGNLKFDVPPPMLPADERDAVRSAVSGRPCWAAVSIHPGEDEAVVDVHQALARSHGDILTIVVPRHPEKGEAMAGTARARSLSVALRTESRVPSRSTGLFVVDTIGETGLAFETAGIVFMGGSLVPHGGQNPIEAAKLSTAILHGPHVGNFSDIYEALDGRGGATCVGEGAALAAEVGRLLADPPAVRQMAAAAGEALAVFGGALERTMDALTPHLRSMAERV